MRKLLFVLIVVLSLAVGVPAQSREFEQGARAAREEKFDTALTKFQIALAKLQTARRVPPEFFAKLQYNIGVCLFRSNRPAEASENFRAAIAASGETYQKAFYALGMAQTALKNRRAARDAFESAIRLKNDDGEAWFDLALVEIEAKDFQSAAASFIRAIEHRSVGSPAAHNNLGVIAAFNGDFATAEKEFEIALELSNGAMAEAKSNLAFCRLRRQNLSAELKFSRQLLVESNNLAIL